MGIKKGFSTLEILISSSILVFLITSLFSFAFLSIREIMFWQEKVEAIYLAQQGQELARYFQEPREEEINGFSRSITLEPVFRNIKGNIASEGVLDKNTKKAVVKVSFNNQEIKLINYLTNWYE